MSDLIKRVEAFYVGFKKPESGNTLPLAFLTPYENNAAGKKRQETVDTWAQGYGGYVNGLYEAGKPFKGAEIVQNEPLHGFCIAKSVKRTSSWNGGNVVWRIEDPRGFEWEIPSNNLAQIITQTGIAAGGCINERCVVGRIGSNNILIPEGTDLWGQMEVDMAKRDKKANAKVISGYGPGHWITLKNGDEGWYMGHEKVRLGARFLARPGPTGPTADPYHLFVQKTTYGWYQVKAYKTLPVVSFDPNNILTAAEEIAIRKGDKLSISFAGTPPQENAFIVGFV